MSSCSYKTVPDIKIERSIITVAGIDKLNAAVVINNKVKNIKHEIVMDAKCKVDLGKGSYLKEGQIRAQVTLGESVQQINKDYFMNPWLLVIRFREAVTLPIQKGLEGGVTEAINHGSPQNSV